MTGHIDRKAATGAAVLAGRHLHATQISPAAVLWRGLQLLGECEYLRWLLPHAEVIARPRPA